MEVTQELIDHLFKAVIGGGVAIAVWVLKDFKKSLDEVSSNLNKVAMSVTELIQKDIHREQSLERIQVETQNLHRKVEQVEKEVIRISFSKQDKE